MADRILGDQQLTGQSNQSVDAIDIDAQRRHRRLCSERARLLGRRFCEALENSIDGLDNGLGISGHQATLQRALEVCQVQRPAMMA